MYGQKPHSHALNVWAEASHTLNVWEEASQALNVQAEASQALNVWAEAYNMRTACMGSLTYTECTVWAEAPASPFSHSTGNEEEEVAELFSTGRQLQPSFVSLSRISQCYRQTIFQTRLDGKE